MGLPLFSAITFRRAERYVLIIMAVFCLVMFGRVSWKTDGTRDQRNFPRHQDRPLQGTFHHPSRAQEEGSLPCTCWIHSCCYHRGFIWLPVLAGWVTVSCSICSTLELPGLVLQSFFSVQLTPKLCVDLSHPSFRTFHLHLLNSIKFLLAHFQNLSS